MIVLLDKPFSYVSSMMSSKMRNLNIRQKNIKHIWSWGHDHFSACKTFERTKLMPRNKAREKAKKGYYSSALVFSTKYNRRGPNRKTLVRRHIHLIRNCTSLNEIFSGDVMVTFKREKNLKELLMRGDPYKIKKDSNDHSKHGYKRCNKICNSYDNFVLETDHIISNATGKR